ncbi:MAG: AAA family ATPase [archaeon]|nr:AAA family ATPase [Candidatus Micrarchaeota archaeon]
MKEYFSSLKENESIFSNIDSLSLDYLPKFLFHRENEQKHIAETIKPLLNEGNAGNLLIHGLSGIGKTHAVKRVLEDLREEEGEEIGVGFVNCWKLSSSQNILEKISKELGYGLTQGLNEVQLIEKIKLMLKTRKGLVLAFDEIDKAEEYRFLYTLLEELESKSIILITNNPEWIALLDARIKSRLIPETIEFKEYGRKEVEDIIKERIKLAFFENSWEENAIKLVAGKTFQSKDIRKGIHLLKEAGMNAENKGERIVREEEVEKAISKI